MSDFRKPRPDYPIYPSAGYYRKRAQVFKRPKGRKGKKPKGQKLVPRGNAYPFNVSQAQDFLIIKAQDEARKARELALAQAQEQEELRQLQIADIEDERVERRRKERARQEELQIRRDEFALSAATQREQLRLQGEAQEETTRYRTAKIERLDYERAEKARDREELAGHLGRLYEENERRAGENLEMFRTTLQSITDRRPVDFRDVRAQEQTDLNLSPEERRDRRSRSPSRDSAVSVGFESFAEAPKPRASPTEPEPQPEPEKESPELPEEEGFGGGHRTRTAESIKKPARFQGGATKEELAAAGGIEGETPLSVRGGSGFKETKRRGKDAGKESTPVIGGSKERLEALSLTEKTPSQVKKEVEGVKFSPATTGGLTESQVSRDLEELAKAVKGD